MNKRILVSCPINSREWVLPYYLEHIYNIDYDRKLIDIYWIVNNSKDNSLNLLKNFKEKYQNEYNSITIEIYNSKKESRFTDDRSIIAREEFTFYWLSELRNKILKKCVLLNCDYLFSSDCDILIKPDTLIRLLSHDLPIVSNLLYNGYLHIPKNAPLDYDSISNAYKFPNILYEKVLPRKYEHIVNYRIKNPSENPIGKLIECHFTGASVLMSKEVCEKTNYNWHKQGEDEAWSYSARQAGFKLFCDISLYQQHIMSEELLELYLANKLS